MVLSFSERNRRFEFLDALGLLGLLGLWVARFVPVARLPFWACGFRKLTGWPCPGCGLTRSADRLVHGHVWQALEIHPLGTLAYVVLGLAAVWMVLHLLVGLPTPRLAVSDSEAKALRWGVWVALGLNYAYVLVRTGLG